ncbi:MAG: response regulator [Rhodospirillaceae bacterium]|nr:response regulator [Rhodospirillaceae bacterium]
MTEVPTVFVVDDDAGMRDSLRFLFEAEELPAEFFASAKAFLAAGAAGRIGCLLADVRMPDMTGLELQEELKRLNSPLSVILMTGHADVPMAVNAMRAGAFDFIEKPFADAALLASVRRALEQARARPLPAPATSAQSAAVASRLGQLTPREREVLNHLVHGSPHKVIAHALGISPRTVEVHRARIMSKLEARNLAHLVEMMLTSGAVVPRT